MFNSNRLSLARKRRRLTGKSLAERTGLSVVTLSRLEKGLHRPDDDSLRRIAEALDYPIEFFRGDNPEHVEAETVSFRSLKKMSAKEREAALSAGSLGLQLFDWVDGLFNLPESDLLDLSYETSPETAARSLRQYWKLGDKPIGNMLGLLESKGARVLSLSEDTANVDAYSFWRDERPFIFLNSFKSPEHSIFDSAHELGHLVLHRHGGPKQSRSAEHEANLFASAFLMPDHDVKANIRKRYINTSIILKAKFRWRVSAMALAYRLHHLEFLSDWQYRSMCIELGKRGYRTGEPNGVEREKSVIWQKVLSELWKEKTTKTEIAKELNLPQDEIESLIFGLTSAEPETQIDIASRPSLRLV